MKPVITKEEAKIIQKYYYDAIDLLVRKMRYENKLEITVLQLMNVRDSIKSKKFIDTLLGDKK